MRVASPNWLKLRASVLSDTSPEPIGGGALQEAGRRFFEVELHRQRVDDFAAQIVIDHFGNRLVQFLVAQPVGVEIFSDGVGIQRGAVGEGDARAQREGVFGAVGVDSPGFGDPGLDFQRVRVLVGQLVGDLVEDAAVGIKTACGRIQISVRLLFQIDQGAAGFGRRVGGQRLSAIPQ